MGQDNSISPLFDAVRQILFDPAGNYESSAQSPQRQAPANRLSKITGRCARVSRPRTRFDRSLRPRVRLGDLRSARWQGRQTLPQLAHRRWESREVISAPFPSAFATRDWSAESAHTKATQRKRHFAAASASSIAHNFFHNSHLQNISAQSIQFNSRADLSAYHKLTPGRLSIR
jgi:hypothetical protein